MTNSSTQDRLTGFLQPDVVLPTQFFQSLRSKSQFNGERRLMVAVLEDAVNCFMKQLHASDPKARQLFVEAAEWISADDRTWYFAFENVCDILDLNHEYIRAGLFKWRVAERRRVGDAAVANAMASVATDDALDRLELDPIETRLANRG